MLYFYFVFGEAVRRVSYDFHIHAAAAKRARQPPHLGHHLGHDQCRQIRRDDFGSDMNIFEFEYYYLPHLNFNSDMNTNLIEYIRI
jgi:hypothetical protein